jgi:hypothetical protein
MELIVRLDEVLTPELLQAHDEHIRAYLLLEGIDFDPNDPGAARLSQRKCKELLEELAAED